jgi:dipeptidyl aminopeptidase/acylaminoacyl peptidase
MGAILSSGLGRVGGRWCRDGAVSAGAGLMLLLMFASAANGAASHFANGGFVYEHVNAIFIAGPNGTAPTRLTTPTPTTSSGSPVFSPDGTRIAFVRGGATPNDIFVMDSDGSGVVNLTSTPNANENDPTWSPDGTRIAYTRCGNSRCGLWTMSSTGSNQRPVKGNVSGFEPSWSPDGRLIAFDTASGGAGCGERIGVVRPDGSHLRLVTSCHVGGESPSWAPNGQRLAFVRSPSPRSRIWVVNRDGSHAHAVMSRPIPLLSTPAWSPDGTGIAFSYGDRKGGVVRVDGRDKRMILTPATNINWRPAACTIAGTSGPDHLVGTVGDDVLCGLGGNDVIAGRGGSDIISGGSGKHDAVSFAWAPAGVKLRVSRAAAAHGREFLSGVEDVLGSSFSDVILGDSEPNRFQGGRGADVILGSQGNDVARGGPSHDVIAGGHGLDHLYGQRGADTLDALDGHGGDVVDGGLGADTCLVNRRDRVIRC